jgi:hypothetical protein
MAIAIEASLIGLGPTALIRAGVGEVRAAELLSVFFIGFLVARVLLTFVAHRLPALTTATLALLGCGLLAERRRGPLVHVAAGCFAFGMLVTTGRGVLLA